jgi:hypothetical protein
MLILLIKAFIWPEGSLLRGLDKRLSDKININFIPVRILFMLSPEELQLH